MEYFYVKEIFTWRLHTFYEHLMNSTTASVYIKIILRILLFRRLLKDPFSVVMMLKTLYKKLLISFCFVNMYKL